MDLCRRRLARVSAILFCFWTASALDATELRLANRTGIVGARQDIPLFVVTPEAIQGLVAVADWDATVARGVDLRLARPIENRADHVVTNVNDEFFALSLVFDVNGVGVGGDFLPAGQHVLAYLTIEGLRTGADTELTFRDGVYSLDSGGLGPPVDNVVVVNGFAFGSADDPPLELKNGRVSISEFPATVYRVEDQVSRPGATRAEVEVLMDAFQPLQGYVFVVAHDAMDLRVVEATIADTDAEAAGAEFFDVEVSDGGVVVAVIMDSSEPFDDQTVGPGEGLSIGRILYELADPPDPTGEDCLEPNGSGSVETALEFVDFVLGRPAKENVVVVEGESQRVDTRPGVLTFHAPSPVFCDPGAKVFACGGDLVRVERHPFSGLFDYSDGEFHYVRDADGDFIIDDRGGPAPLQVEAGADVEVNFYYLSPPADGTNDGSPNIEDDDDIQGLSLSVRYGEQLLCAGSYSIDGTITEAVNAEFVNVHCRNEASGRGGGELILGLLVDALPPFDGVTLPPTVDFFKIVEIDFKVVDDVRCGTSVAISFEDGLRGQGFLPINNSIAVRNQTIRFPELRSVDCITKIVAKAVFHRGDCNFDAIVRSEFPAVTIADAAAVLGYLFLPRDEAFDPPCPDACDANDDSRLDISDAVKVLRYLFLSEDSPPAPGPVVAGEDPTEDHLSCKAGRICIP